MEKATWERQHSTLNPTSVQKQCLIHYQEWHRQWECSDCSVKASVKLSSSCDVLPQAQRFVGKCQLRKRHRFFKQSGKLLKGAAYKSQRVSVSWKCLCFTFCLFMGFAANQTSSAVSCNQDIHTFRRWPWFLTTHFMLLKSALINCAELHHAHFPKNTLPLCGESDSISRDAERQPYTQCS